MAVPGAGPACGAVLLYAHRPFFGPVGLAGHRGAVAAHGPFVRGGGALVPAAEPVCGGLFALAGSAEAAAHRYVLPPLVPARAAVGAAHCPSAGQAGAAACPARGGGAVPCGACGRQLVRPCLPPARRADRVGRAAGGAGRLYPGRAVFCAAVFAAGRGGKAGAPPGGAAGLFGGAGRSFGRGVLAEKHCQPPARQHVPDPAPGGRGVVQRAAGGERRAGQAKRKAGRGGVPCAPLVHCAGAGGGQGAGAAGRAGGKQPGAFCGGGGAERSGFGPGFGRLAGKA